ncbi:MAG: helix-turn-helix transcriptional regulator [Hungatella sp.]|jgi:DNA-binding Xre family transcriptional regulator|uniref:helix-turn-helix domain-containing protein n=1 Tax=Clostridium sp. NkU-1 TaxID=1095009 RepID=UPI0006CFCE40|nr:helix-turn-helix transcriptional regulator [Hungatella sp.]MDR1548025.1 helix-turn-helix transcriptional regulator [Hungatella sp.]MDR2022511.1 helix-turn-helix transcriptional regulator [Hungatella sp.]
MIVYDRLWETMKKKNISQYHLIKYCKVSAGQIGRLKKNNFVSTHTIDMLCRILDCDVEEIMEYRADISEVALPKESEPKAEQDNVPPKDLA